MRVIDSDGVELRVYDSTDKRIDLVDSESARQPLENPVLFIVTEGGAPIVSKEIYINCTYTLRNQGGFGVVLLQQAGRIRGRGNSTWTMPKKPYKVKFNSSVPVLDLPSSKDFALLANYIDPSRIRNEVAFEMSHRAGLAWAPRSINMEAYLNDSYQGLYQFTESVEVDVNRVNIAKIKDTDVGGLNLTGGYVMEVDTRLEVNGEVGWRTRLGVPIIFDIPDGLISQQFTYIQSFFQEAEDALFANNFLGGGWREYFEMDSWAEWYLMTELTANNDSGFGASVKITKPRDTASARGKLILGPAWDYDASFGITFFIPHPPTGWWTRVGATWIARMLEDPVFFDVLKTRWAILKSNLEVPGTTIYDFIDRLELEVDERRTRDLDHWGTSSAPDISSYLATRLAWMDSELTDGYSDTIPPDTPTGFTASAVEPNSITFTWTDAGTNQGTGVVGYRIRQAGTIVAMTAYPYSDPINSVTITDLSPATAYSFTLEARDATGNWSTPTAAVDIVTAV